MRACSSASILERIFGDGHIYGRRCCGHPKTTQTERAEWDCATERDSRPARAGFRLAKADERHGRPTSLVEAYFGSQSFIIRRHATVSRLSRSKHAVGLSASWRCFTDTKMENGGRCDEVDDGYGERGAVVDSGKSNGVQ